MELARRYSRFNFEVLREPKNVALGGKVFSRMDTSMDSLSGTSLYQAYVSTVLNGYALIFVLDERKRERLDDLFQTLNTLQFKAQLAPPTQESSNKRQLWEILTPTMGVDFRPYVNRFLAVALRNWRTVMPEEALKGTKGIVVLRFHIQQDGEIPANEPWIERTSGSDPLDNAAAAAIRNRRRSNRCLQVIRIQASSFGFRFSITFRHHADRSTSGTSRTSIFACNS